VEPNTLRGGVARPNVAATSAARARAWLAGRDRLPFGPNSDRVLALLRRVSVMAPLDAERLAGYWGAVPAGERTAAHAAAQQAAEASDRRAAARAAQGEAMRWLNDESYAADIVVGETASGRRRDWAQVRREAFPAVLDAVAAVVLADVLDARSLEVLFGPWSAADGPPEGASSGDE
jgi:hypothetical protein